MVSCYGFKAMGPGVLVEHPSSADLSRMMQSEESEVIESVKQGDGDAQPVMVDSAALVGKHDNNEVNRKALA